MGLGQRKPKAGKNQVVHRDLQQCDDREWHLHDLCACDPDAPHDVDLDPPDRQWNTRAHIKQHLGGHWPLAPGQDVVVCERCGGAIKKTSSHRAALHYRPLETGDR